MEAILFPLFQCDYVVEMMTGMKNPTIKDVAREANTSKSTVSRFLNGTKVKKETEIALEKAIKKLNYFPNANARRLVSDSTKVVGVIVDDISNFFYSDILRGIEEVINQFGIHCAYYSRTSYFQGEWGFMDLAREKQVDGLIVVSFLNRSQTFIKQIKELQLPVALIGDADFEDDIFSVDVNNQLGLEQLVHYLVQAGHKNIAYIEGPDEFSATHWRKKGYKEALIQFGLNYHPDYVYKSDWTEPGGYQAMEKILENKDITAVIASNDEMAIGAIRCAQEQSYRVPHDISVAGFDDIVVAKWIYPALTTVKQPTFQMGKKATEFMVSHLDSKAGDPVKKERHLLDPALIVRQSCRNM